MSRRLALLGVVLGPFVWAAYLLVVGVENLPEPFGFYPSSIALWATFLLSAAGVGSLVLWAARPLPVTAAVLAIVLALLPWTASPPVSTLFHLNYHLLFVLVAGVVLAVVEYGFRNPDRIRGWLTPRAIRYGTIIGLGHLGLVVVLRTFVFDLSWGGGSLPAMLMVAWMLVGAVLVGGVPGLLFGRYRLVAPLAVVITALAWSTYATWIYLQELDASGAAMGIAFTEFTFYLVVWFVVLGAALLAGLLEYRVRYGRGVFATG